MKCIIVNCHRMKANHGLCLVCYSKAKKAVESGKVTWEKLTEIGLAERGANVFDTALDEALSSQQGTQPEKDMSSDEYGAACDPKRFGE